MDIFNKKISFHIHTKYSFDSNLEPSFIVDHLVKSGYELAIVTDHNSIKGALEAKKYAQNKYMDNFKVIVGEEVQTNIGDIIGFPVQEEVKPGDYKRVIKELKRQGAMLCLPHPYHSHDLFLIHDKEFLSDFDFIEIFNARIPAKLNINADQLRIKHNKYPIIGNDAHVKGDLLNCYFEYDTDFSIIQSERKYTDIKNVRKSQIINFSKKKKIMEIVKYLLLYIIGK